MKPNLDLTDTRIATLIRLLQEKAAMALDANRKIEGAVYPLYSIHKRILQHSGSSVALRLKSEYFLLSASHVFDEIADCRLAVGCGNGKRLAQLDGERFSSAKGPSGSHKDDPIDASVFHIQCDIPEEIKADALDLNDLRTEQDEPQNRFLHGSVGFRCSQTMRIGAHSTVKRELFPTLEYGDEAYAALSLNARYHLALAHDDQIMVNGLWQTSPQPRGFSGGAMIKFSGIPVDPAAPLDNEVRPYLAAIIIEQRRGTKTTPGALIGTRVRVHLGLIDQFLPGLIEFSEPKSC